MTPTLVFRDLVATGKTAEYPLADYERHLTSFLADRFGMWYELTAVVDASTTATDTVWAEWVAIVLQGNRSQDTFRRLYSALSRLDP